MLFPLRVLASTSTGVQPPPQDAPSCRGRQEHTQHLLLGAGPDRLGQSLVTLANSSGCRRRSLFTQCR